MDRDESRPAGGPRNDAMGPAVLAVTRRLVIEHGDEGVSIQMIAAEAHVGRQSLYRRWSGKADLVLDAFLENAKNSELPDASKTKTTAAALEHFLQQLFENLATDGPAIRSLIASAQRDPEFLQTFKSRFVQPGAEIVAAIVRGGITRGDVSPTVDIDTVVMMLHGAFWYPLLLGEIPSRASASHIVQTIFHGIA